MTITGNGGLKVIDINGNITSSLTLKGTAADTSVVLVTGVVTFGGSDALGVIRGVPPVTCSTPLQDLAAQSVPFNGEIIKGGKNISLLSGAVV